MTSARIPEGTRAEVRERAGHRCEYCGLSQRGQEAEFHIDHVQPRASGGNDEISNLALACVGCSLRKAAKSRSCDPESGRKTPLFNPREQVWRRHFRVEEDFTLTGRTAAGRATVVALRMNGPKAVGCRKEQAGFGRYPPPD